MKRSVGGFFYVLLVSCIMAVGSQASGFEQENWSLPLATGRNLLDVQMLDNNTIIAVGGNEFNDAISTIIRSDNRGQNWYIILDAPFSPWLQSVHFITATKGFIAGHDGLVLRTVDAGLSWDTLDLPGNSAFRDYNDVYFTSENTGFLVGGNQTNDSIQTILKTVDGGDNWQIVSDNLGYWLNAVHFVSPLVGFASGESGVLLKTIDGGDSWTELVIQGNIATRHYNDIRFTDELNGIAVGGNEKNDSIRTILKTTDGGNNWTISMDGIASWLNGIEILPSGALVVVGNDSTILRSDDGGNSWDKVIIPSDINLPYHLNAIDFIHNNLGIVVGNYGQMLIYEGELPSLAAVTVNPPIVSNLDSVWISGTVSARGSDTEVFFDYGPSTNLEFTIDAYPSVVFGSDSTYVEALISAIPPGIYFYQIRAENEAGITVSDLKQLYIGNAFQDANLDFEFWDEETIHLPESWLTIGTVFQGVSYDGTLAATLVGSNTDTVAAAIFGDVNDDVFAGGIPVSSTPDSIVGYFNYDLEPGTEGFVLAVLKNDGVILSQEIFTYTGTSSGSFERLAFPIAYSGTVQPDSIVLGFANNNPFQYPIGTSNSVSVDDVSFSPTSVGQISNGDFEAWENIEAAHPVNWMSKDNEDAPHINETVFRETDAQHGQYALKLTNNIGRGESGEIGTTPISQSPNIPSFKVGGRHQTFNGYLKYDKQSTRDTLRISLQLYSNGNDVGNGWLQIDSTISSYSPFSIDIYYSSPSVIPDSARIDIRIGMDTLLGASVLLLDNLSFDGFNAPYVPLNVGIEELVAEPASLLVYPNPSNGLVWIESFNQRLIDRVEVLGLNGQLVHQRMCNTSSIQLDMANYPAGIYFLRIFSNDSNTWQTRKLIIY